MCREKADDVACMSAMKLLRLLINNDCNELMTIKRALFASYQLVAAS